VFGVGQPVSGGVDERGGQVEGVFGHGVVLRSVKVIGAPVSAGVWGIG
jgi:hypothetical protein